MTDTIRITASLRIHRPAEEVRQQYRDIDHHIRNNVHPSIKYRWEAAAPGERKIRTTFSILGVPQYDVSRLEDGENGTFVIRYLEGSNAGMVLVHRFVPLGPDETEVQLEADAPATLGRKLLGPLFVVGARQVMKKALAEDKRDLEGGKYRIGRAAGHVDQALDSLTSLRTLDPDSKRALLEAVVLIAVADGQVEAAERDALGRLVGLIAAEGEAGFVDVCSGALTAVARTEAIANEADRIGRTLRARSVGLEGVTAAVVVALVSDGMSLGELGLLRRLATSAGVTADELSGLIEGAERVLSTGC